MDIGISAPPANQENSIWTESFQVRTLETDVTGHLGILPLFNYFQEVAGNHARALGVSIEALQEQQLTWMLSRFHVQVDRYPARGETVVFKTWPSGHTGLLALREFLIYTDKGEKLGQGTSGWLIIDLKRYRPIRMPAFIDAIETPDLPRPIEDSFNKLPAPKKVNGSRVFSVGYHDLDINQHTNSVHFIRWALESVPYDFRTTHQLKGLEVQFRAEAKYGDGITSHVEKDSSSFRHGICERTSEKDLAIIRSTWNSK